MYHRLSSSEVSPECQQRINRYVNRLSVIGVHKLHKIPNQFYFMKNNREGLKLSSKMALKLEMEYEFPFGIFCPEKQDYLFWYSRFQVTWMIKLGAKLKTQKNPQDLKRNQKNLMLNFLAVKISRKHQIRYNTKNRNISNGMFVLVFSSHHLE